MIRCIQIGTVTVQGHVVSIDGDRATIICNGRRITGRLIESKEAKA